MTTACPWRIWYDDGSTFSSEDGRPQDSPPFGVLAIGQRTRDGMEVLGDGRPWYIYRDDLKHWLEVDEGGFLDQISHHAHVISAARFGRYHLKTRFRECYDAAREWVTHG